MISSAEEALSILRKWHDDSTLLLVSIGVEGTAGVTLRGALVTVSSERVEFAGFKSSTKGMMMLHGAQFEFLHPNDVSLLKHLNRKIRIVDSALQIRSTNGALCVLFPLPDTMKEMEQ